MKENIEYIKVFADYESDDMPVVYFYEVDLANERLALRAIEVFTNRQVESINDLYRNVVEVVPIPTVEELNSKVWGDGFCATVISREEFEKIWNNDFYYGNLEQQSKNSCVNQWGDKQKE